MSSKQQKSISKLVIMIVSLSFLLPLLVSTSYATDDPTQQWIKIYDGGKTDKACAVAIDSNDNIIVTGVSKIGEEDKCYTIKYDQNGAKILDIVTINAHLCQPYDVSVDSQNSIIIAGTCNINGNNDYLIVKYDSDGNEQWSKTYDSGDQDIAYGIAIDSNDNIVVTGQSSGNYYTIKYDKFGVELWNKTYTNSYEDCSKSVAIDHYDNVIVTGYIYTDSSRDWHTIKYTSTGVELWSKTYSNGEYNTANDVTIDTDNNIIVVGAIYTDANSDFYIIKYNKNGVELWNKAYDQSTSDSAADVTINIANDIIIIGSSVQTHQGKNYALLKFDSDGNYVWSKNFDRNYEDDYGTGVAVDSLNKIIITGFSKGLYSYDYLTIKYGGEPIASFTYEPLQPTEIDVIQFSDTSIDPAGVIVEWHWNFGDGNTSILQHPTHQYADDATYLVTLTVTDDDGSVDTISKQLQVFNIPPTANFTCSLSAASQNAIQFNDSSYDLDGYINDWTWNFGDGNVSYNRNTTHQYATNGTYTVTLTVTDNDGALDTKTKIVSRPPSKVTGLTVTDAKDGKLDLSWNALSDTITIDYYIIYRDDVFLITETTTSYRDTGLTNGQSYSYQISAVNIYGIEGEKSDPVSNIPIASSSGGGNSGGSSGGKTQQSSTTNQHPIADASADEPYMGFIDETITFDGSMSYDLDGTINSYFWDFGDGTNGLGEITTHKYLLSGTYTVTLTVTDNNGATDNYETITLIMIPNKHPSTPTITGPSEGTKNTEYSYTAQSTDEDDDYIQYVFDWDDGETTTTEFLPNGTMTTRTHTWTTAGRYIIKVNATDDKTVSKTTEYVVLIDAVEIKDNGTYMGYLKDHDGDGIYDSFYNYVTQQETSVEYIDINRYLIDIGGDGEWDAVYDVEKEELTTYEKEPIQKQEGDNIIIIFLWLLLIFLIIFIFLLIRSKNKAKPRRKSQKMVKVKKLFISQFLRIGRNKANRGQFTEEAMYQTFLKDIEDFVDSLTEEPYTSDVIEVEEQPALTRHKHGLQADMS